ncbi:GntR family transcriptional regulator [Paracoccus aestuariivivens]|uniref:GntR family transcriptional regulator n=1 Tax=Paracoccus aestuariivivens TaxID=1820333 RepID=A0A6L6JDZ2_9RHOB|nr:GntR family transcriptional regulator [Paracoccus aestuariivivens]MTH79736.1 GntR family transcriptional regulator [Paracoccus aestuariivivens]
MSERSADHIHALLSERIISGGLRPGAPLAEAAIAAEFGVSRTPVREALHRLSTEGLIERGARRAFIVRRMGVADLAELFEALGEIEATCAGLAARRMTEIEISALATILTDDANDYARLNSRFHAALRAGARNQVLTSLATDLERRSLPWRDASFRIRSDRIDRSREEHDDILRAITARDGERAAALMRTHMARSLHAISELLAKD